MRGLRGVVVSKIIVHVIVTTVSQIILRLKNNLKSKRKEIKCNNIKMQVASFDKYDRGEGYGKNIPKVLRMCLKPQYHYLKRLE